MLARLKLALSRYLSESRWSRWIFFPEVRIHRSVSLELDGRSDRIGVGSTIDPLAVISTRGGGRVRIGERCEIGRGVLIMTYGGDIEIGDDCSFNPYCVIYGHGGLKIGNSVRVAAHTVMIPSNHTFEDLNVPIRLQPSTSVGISIGSDVWIGAGVRILDGVVISDGCVIAAGTVVTRSAGQYSVLAGVPGRLVKTRGARS